ncbi:SpoIIE family protein phosphatase [Actinokineospora soli]|uniref:SpoIIE family protein phosphatase n=1 Tax=Actinokineospora soli TaxID=1048753 RepID=A0ABW2TS79_9PSEU
MRSAAPGESVCGDAWVALGSGDALTVVVCDGLGHGVLAAAASKRAVEIADTHQGVDPGSLLGLVSDGLTGTRGAAVAAARVDPDRGEVRFAGIGNITASLYAPGELSARALISTPGICGVAAGRSRPQVSTHPWTAGTALVMHSDGVHSRWSLRDWPGSRDHDPTTLAAWVLWQANRRRDDACALVVTGGPR